MNDTFTAVLDFSVVGLPVFMQGTVGYPKQFFTNIGHLGMQASHLRGIAFFNTGLTINTNQLHVTDFVQSLQIALRKSNPGC